MEFRNSDEPVSPLPAIDRFTGIIASPSDVFENVRQTEPVNSNWLVPWIIYVLLSMLMTQLLLTNPSLRSQLEASIKTKVEQSLQEAIEKGQITREQAEQQYEQFAKPGSPWFTMLSIAGTLFGSLLILFALSFFYYLLGKSVMNATMPYMKVVEVVGLTFFIGALEQIITIVLMYAFDSIHTSPSLALLLTNVGPESKWHLALSKVNVFTLWDLTVTGIGLSTLFQRDLPKVLVLLFALWLLWSGFSVLTGFSLSS